MGGHRDRLGAGFVDYRPVSVTTSSAFSPANSMSLWPRGTLLTAVGRCRRWCCRLLVTSYGVGQLK